MSSATVSGRALGAEFSGTVFDKGFFRIYTVTQGEVIGKLIDGVFPKYEGRVEVFAGDWMGRQWVTDTVDRTERGEPAICLVHPQDGVLEVPGGLTELFDQIADLSEELFMPAVYSQWKAEGHEPLKWNECLSLKVPEIFGGRYVAENLEVCDLDVDWSVTSQISDQLADVPEGTEVEIRRSEG